MSTVKRRIFRSSCTSYSTPAPISSSSSSSDEADKSLMQPLQRAPPRMRRLSRFPVTLLVVSIAVVGGLLHCGHVANLHENHLSFAYLSNVEREMTFRSEMAFYYSFYKQILMAASFYSGWKSLFNDTVTEFSGSFGGAEEMWKADDWGVLPAFSTPAKTSEGINVLERFNVYPEVILAGLYRILSHFGLRSECFEVAIEGIDQSHALAVPPNQISGNWSFVPPLQPMGTVTGSKVLSCEGSREPPIFYVNSVFFLSGLTVIGLVLSGWQVANSGIGSSGSTSSLVFTIWGALLPLVGFYCNHQHATRVQWSPPLRESFAYPFFVLQQTLLIWLLQDISPGRRQPRRVLHYLLYTLLLLAFQLPWQFAQFALLTQLLALMVTYGIVVLEMFLVTPASATPSTVAESVNTGVLCSFTRRLLDILGCQLVALIISWAAQLGNRLLLTSAYLPCLVGCLIGLLTHWSLLNRRQWSNSRFSQFARLFVLLVSCLAAVLVVRLLMHYLAVDFSDGAHILDLVKLKLFNGNRTFHTQLYTCSEVFDFLPMSTWLELTQTGLLPCAALAVLVTFRQVLLLRGVDHSDISACASKTSTRARSSTRAHKTGDSSATPEGEREASDGETWAPPTISCKSFCLHKQICMTRITPAFIADIVSVFVVVQLFAFGILATLVMRLKIFFIPQLCLVLAILAQLRLYLGSHKMLPYISLTNQTKGLKKRHKYGHNPPAIVRVPSQRRLLLLHLVFTVIVAFAVHQGVHNLRIEWSKRGQFSDFPMETLLNWASQLPPPPPAPHPDVWVLSGAMPTMAMLRLGLVVPSLPSSLSPAIKAPTPDGRHVRFAVTNHPHYENAAIRSRTELAFAACSRKPAEAVWWIYRHILKTDFVVIERDWCLSPGAQPGCSSVELWDLLDPSFAARGATGGPLCAAAFKETPLPKSISRFFSLVFRSTDYSLAVWRVVP